MTTAAIVSPYDFHPVGEVPVHDATHLKTVLDQASAAFEDRKSWLSVADRMGILERFSKLFESQTDKLVAQAAAEGGKPWQDSLVEVKRALNGIRLAIETLPHLTGTEIPMNLNASSANRLAYTFREPGGLVTAISAFNHPVNLVIHQVVPAIATGCPVVIKPASKTPLSCFTIVDLLHQAGLPPAWCQAVMCDSTTAKGLVTDSRINFLTFIGSARVGWSLRAELPPGATCTLEHGGAAPVIIEPDADLQDAIPLLVKGGFYHAGQVCVSVQRIYAHESIAKTVADALAERAKHLIVGDPLDPKTEVGPLIHPDEVTRVASWVKEAIDQGATLLCGGKRLSDTCYAPTVLFNPPDHARVSTTEIFGPVVCVYGYATRDEAIQRANQLPLCFQSAVFTQNIHVAFDMVRRLKATTVLINDHTAFRVDWMPFGGRQESGLGIGGIPQSMMEMTAEKQWILRSPVL